MPRERELVKSNTSALATGSPESPLRTCPVRSLPCPSLTTTGHPSQSSGWARTLPTRVGPKPRAVTITAYGALYMSRGTRNVPSSALMSSPSRISDVLMPTEGSPGLRVSGKPILTLNAVTGWPVLPSTAWPMMTPGGLSVMVVSPLSFSGCFPDREYPLAYTDTKALVEESPSNMNLPSPSVFTRMYVFSGFCSE